MGLARQSRLPGQGAPFTSSAFFCSHLFPPLIWKTQNCKLSGLGIFKCFWPSSGNNWFPFLHLTFLGACPPGARDELWSKADPDAVTTFRGFAGHWLSPQGFILKHFKPREKCREWHPYACHHWNSTMNSFLSAYLQAGIHQFFWTIWKASDVTHHPEMLHLLWIPLPLTDTFTKEQRRIQVSKGDFSATG